MEIILLSKSSSSSGPIRIGRFVVALCAVLFIGLIVLTGYISFKTGQLDVEMRPDFSKALVQEQIRQQQTQIDLAIGDAQTNVNALALRLGEMQADLIRLDALGKRLVVMAQLDAEEFDFSAQPAMVARKTPARLRPRR